MDPDPGSGAFLTPGLRIRDPGWRQFGSGIRDKHPGSATLSQTHIFDTIILSVLAKKILNLFKNKTIYNFMIFVATKKGRTKKNFPPPLWVLLLDPGSGIRDRQTSW